MSALPSQLWPRARTRVPIGGGIERRSASKVSRSEPEQGTRHHHISNVKNSGGHDGAGPCIKVSRLARGSLRPTWNWRLATLYHGLARPEPVFQSVPCRISYVIGLRMAFWKKKSWSWRFEAGIVARLSIQNISTLLYLTPAHPRFTSLRARFRCCLIPLTWAFPFTFQGSGKPTCRSTLGSRSISKRSLCY